MLAIITWIYRMDMYIFSFPEIKRLFSSKTGAIMIYVKYEERQYI